MLLRRGILLFALTSLPVFALTNSTLRDFGFRGVLKLGNVESKNRCSGIFVGESAERFYVATAAHCLENFKDGGLSVLDYYRSLRRSYLSTKVFLMRGFLENKEIESNLIKLRALEREKVKVDRLRAVMSIAIDKVDVLALRMQVKGRPERDQVEDLQEMATLSRMLLRLDDELRKERIEGRTRVLGPPPEDLSLRDDYYSFEGAQNIYYQALSQEPDLAVVEFDKSEWIHRPSPELESILENLPTPVIAAQARDDVAIGYVGYGDLALPREGSNHILKGRGIDDTFTQARVGRFVSILGVHPADLLAPLRQKIPVGKWSAVEPGDSGGAAFEGELLRGVMVTKRVRYLSTAALKDISWAEAEPSGYKEYLSLQSESIDLASPDVHDFLKGLRDQGIPLVFEGGS